MRRSRQIFDPFFQSHNYSIRLFTTRLVSATRKSLRTPSSSLLWMMIFPSQPITLLVECAEPLGQRQPLVFQPFEQYAATFRRVMEGFGDKRKQPTRRTPGKLYQALKTTAGMRDQPKLNNANAQHLLPSPLDMQWSSGLKRLHAKGQIGDNLHRFRGQLSGILLGSEVWKAIRSKQTKNSL